jgi:hypothetical protein
MLPTYVIIPVGARFFAHVQTGPEAHPASCTMGTESFPGVMQPGRGTDHPPPSSAEVKKEYSYTFTHPLGHFRPVTGQLYLYLFTYVIMFLVRQQQERIWRKCVARR